MAHTVWNAAEFVWWRTGNGALIGWAALAVVVLIVLLK